MIQRYLDARGMNAHLTEQRQSGVDKEATLRERKLTLSRELSELEGNQYRKAFGRGVDVLQLKLQQQQQQTQSAPHACMARGDSNLLSTRTHHRLAEI